jgi:hypothetical protein
MAFFSIELFVFSNLGISNLKQVFFLSQKLKPQELELNKKTINLSNLEVLIGYFCLKLEFKLKIKFKSLIQKRNYQTTVLTSFTQVPVTSDRPLVT